MKTKKITLLWLLLIALPLVFLDSCKKDEKPDPVNEFLPVLNTNFSFVVDGNDVNFTTTISGNVWVTTNDVQYPFVDKVVTVKLPNKGTYSFTCGSLGSGEVLTSEPFDVVIEQDDLEFLNHGLWLYLSGGANETKTWKMDMIASEGGSVYFDGPVFYSGDEKGPYWAWDITQEVSPDHPYTATLEDNSTKEFTSIFNWSPKYAENTWLMPAVDYGTITFDATNGAVSTTAFGATEEGTFTFDTATLMMTLSENIIIPIDTPRLHEGQFKAEDLANLRIFSLTDSGMQIGIKRSYEGYLEDGVTHKESRWTMIYNFIVADYNYPVAEKFTYEEPIDTEFADADLVGTWKYEDVPFDWVGWKAIGDQGTINDPVPLNNWATPADMIATGWLGITQPQLDAAADVELVFNNDGSCTINSTATTYTLTAGVITFADTVSLTVGDHWFSFRGTSIKILKDVGGAVAGGTWIGNQNEAKFESSSFHILKQ